MTPPIDPERLLAHKGWLTSLARELVGDRQRAEDLVQSTWVAALERPPRAADEPGLRAWLARVARNLARGTHRGDARRAAREQRGARPEHEPSVTDALERFALQRAVVEAVMALEPPAREIVVLRYFEGLAPRQIAARLGLSGPAVRSRLNRALDVLRARLGAERDDQGKTWAALAATAWPRGRALVLGGLTVKVQLVAGGALALLSIIGLGLGAWYRAAPAPIELAVLAPDSAETVPPLDRPRVEEPGGSTPAAREALAPSPPPASGAEPATPAEAIARVVGRCIDPAGRSLADVTVEAPARDGRPRARSGPDGRFELVFPWGAARAHDDLTFSGAGLATRPERTTIEGPGVHALGDVVLEPGGALVGRVVDASGAPLPGARVQAWREAEEASRAELEAWGTFVLGWCSAASETDGSFVLEGAPATRLCVAAGLPGRLFAWSAPIDLSAGSTRRVTDLVLREPRPDRLLGGRVLDPDGDPLGGAAVALFLEDDGARGVGHVWTDEGGRFELVVAPDRTYRVEVADRGGRWNAIARAGVAAGARDLELAFAQARWIEVVARDGAGCAVDGFRVQASERAARVPPLPTEAIEPGRVRVRAPAGSFFVGVAAPGFAYASRGPFTAEAAPARIDFELRSAGALAGTVLAGGVPLAGASVHAHELLAESALFSEGLPTRVEPRPASSAATAADGSFRLGLAQPGRWVVHVEAEGLARAELGPLELREGEELDLGPVALETGGALAGRIVTAAEASPAGWAVVVGRGDGHLEWRSAGAEGTFAFEHLAAGEWRVLRVHPDRVHFLASPGLRALPEELEGWSATVVAGRTTTLELDLGAEQPCTLRGRLLVGGERPRASSFWLANALERVHATLDARGNFEVRSRRAGSHSLVLREDRPGVTACYYAELELEPGANERAFDMPGGALELGGAARGLELSWRGDSGLEWTARVEPDASRPTALAPVPAGRLTLAVDGAPEPRAIELRAGELLRVEVE